MMMMMFTFLPMEANLKTISQTYLCSICNLSLSIENGLAWCNNCNNVSTQGEYKLKAYLRSSILKDNDHLKLHISVFNSILEGKFDRPLSNTAQNVIVCKFINKTFYFQLIDLTSVWNSLTIDNFILLLHDNLNNWLQHS